MVASLLAGTVLVAGIVAAAVTVSRARAPGYAHDEPAIASLLLTSGDVPNAPPFTRHVYSQSQVAGNPSLYPPASVLKTERACALLEGPTDTRKLTALAVDGYSAQYELVAEVAAYSDAGPVEADANALFGGDLLPCLRRLLVALLTANGLHGKAVVQEVPLGVHLGNVRSVALTAFWQVAPPDPSAQFATDRLEFVVLLHGRAEVVILAQTDEGDIPQALVGRVAERLAARLDSHFPG